MNTRVLTGITTTGTPHLGNYVGAIRPAVAASVREGVDAFYFMADYHALIKCDDPLRVQRSRLEIAASWLAAGLDPSATTFYRQSDIPEIPELTWLLTCVTAKGLLNRAHAYKAAVDRNSDSGEDPDAGVTAGLYMYPVLMAADILVFNAHQVPVGRDQIQHIEMARDIAQRFNHLYKGEFFTLPEALVEEHVATLPGLDGRKMSKSYDNTIPLFEGGARAMRDAIMRIVTDSRAPGEPKDTEDCALFTLYRAFAEPAETEAFADALRDGLGWGEAKQQLFERIERDVAPMRERYDALMARPDTIEDVLRQGAVKARELSAPLLQRLREAVGLGRGAARKPAAASRKKAGKGARLLSFREADGQFYFKLVDAHKQPLLTSGAFASGQAAAAAMQSMAAREPDVLAAAARFEAADGGIRFVLADEAGEALAYGPAAASRDAAQMALEQAIGGLRAAAG